MIKVKEIKRQIIIHCQCGNKYHMYGDMPFELDICGPLKLKCLTCGKQLDLFDIGKKVLSEKGSEGN